MCDNWRTLRDIHMICAVLIVLVERISFEKREHVFFCAVFHFERDLWSFDKIVNSFQFCVQSFEKLSYSLRKRIQTIEKNCNRLTYSYCY